MPSILREENSSNNGSFEPFLEGWLARKQSLLSELNRVQETWNASMPEAQIKELITRFMAHFEEYYQEKSRMISQNVYSVFSPTWLTPYERALLWITGFHPEIVLDLALDSVNDLTVDQCHRIQGLMQETFEQVVSLDKELARIQESVAAPPLAELARQEGRQQLAGGHAGGTGAVPARLRLDLENVVVNADSLRMSVIHELAEIFSPIQCVRFLAAATERHIGIRAFGRQIEEDQLRRTNGL